MCYNVTQLKINILKKQLRGDEGNPDIERHIQRLQRELEKEQQEKKKLTKESNFEDGYNLAGFDHPPLLTITSIRPEINLEWLEWGLIPHWTKNEAAAKEIQNRTINARGETVFEKPSFRDAVISQRCVIPVKGFFEHHHLNKIPYPFHIHLKSETDMFLAGIASEWVNPDSGEITKSCSIVTCEANDLLTKIHNNPKAKEPRIPVILDEQDVFTWLEVDSPKALKELMRPYPSELLEVYTVPRLRGKYGVGNTKHALEKHPYPELMMFFPEIW